MNKRILTKLAKAGYFNSANGAFYAATKHAMRKSLHVKSYQVAAETEPEVFNSARVSPSAKGIAKSRHPKPQHEAMKWALVGPKRLL